MKVFLFLVSILAALVGIACFFGAKSAIQEAVGACILAGSAVLFSGACIIDAIHAEGARLRTEAERTRAQLESMRTLHMGTHELLDKVVSSQARTNELLEWLGTEVIPPR